MFHGHAKHISSERLERIIGSDINAIIDAIEDDRIIARSIGDAPEIDGLGYLPYNNTITVGEIDTVLINNSDEYDLYGEIFQ